MRLTADIHLPGRGWKDALCQYSSNLLAEGDRGGQLSIALSLENTYAANIQNVVLPSTVIVCHSVLDFQFSTGLACSIQCGSLGRRLLCEVSVELEIDGTIVELNQDTWAGNRSFGAPPNANCEEALHKMCIRDCNHEGFIKTLRHSIFIHAHSVAGRLA